MKDANKAVLTELSAVDHLAHKALLPGSWTRYVAYRNALIADGVDSEQVVETLAVFLTALVEGHAVNGVH